MARRINGPYLWVAFSIGVGFWFADSILDAIVHGEGSFGDTLLKPSADYLIMRLALWTVAVGFGALAQSEINRRKRAEVALQIEMQRRVEVARQSEIAARIETEEKTRLDILNTISHEVKTPLTVLLTFSGWLRRNESHNLADDQLAHLDHVVRSGQQLNVMIDDMISLSTLSSVSFELSPSEFALGDFIGVHVDALRPIVEEKNQVLSVSLPGEEHSIYGDPIRLGQIVNNLVRNASTYSPRGVQLGLIVDVLPERIKMKTVNPAGDIPPGEHNEAFDLFHRLDSETSRGSRGTGIGLSVCKTIVEKHGGSIRFNVTRDRVVEVELEIPQRPRSAVSG